jgi:hypothetical protein
MKNNRNKSYTGVKKPILERVEAEKDARIFYLFVEGDTRENHYFTELDRLSSKIKLKIFPPGTKSAPQKLFEKAETLCQ